MTGPGVPAVRDAARSVLWWFTSIMGDHDYDAYLSHMARNHPGRPVLDKRAYWRERHDDAETNPKTRCC